MNAALQSSESVAETQGNIDMPLVVYTSLQRAVEAGACVLALHESTPKSDGNQQHHLQLGLAGPHLEGSEGAFLLQSYLSTASIELLPF